MRLQGSRVRDVVCRFGNMALLWWWGSTVLLGCKRNIDEGKSRRRRDVAAVRALVEKRFELDRERWSADSCCGLEMRCGITGGRTHAGGWHSVSRSLLARGLRDPRAVVWTCCAFWRGVRAGDVKRERSVAGEVRESRESQKILGVCLTRA